MRTGSVTGSAGSPGGLGARPHQLIRHLLVLSLQGQGRTCVLSMAQLGKLSAAGQMCSHSLHPVHQQNLPLLGAQQGKSCDKVTRTRETLSQACGEQSKKGS